MYLIDGGRMPNPRRVRIFLAEKGIEVPTRQIDFAAKEQHGDAFRKVNPMQRVPVLILDNGTALAESIAICRFFEALQPDPPLFGSDPENIGLIEMWNRRMELNLYLHIAAVFRHSHPSMADYEVPQVPAWAEANKAKVMASLKWLDEELSQKPYIAGDAFSVADISAMVAIDFLKPAKLQVSEDVTALIEWHGRVKSRPSALA